jgi:o-succinylbenzoate synthase
MKISRVCLYHLRMPLVTPFETSFGRIDSRECILLEAFSDDLIGYGECAADRDPGYGYETTGTAWHILKDFIVPSILSKEISGPEVYDQWVSFVKGHQMAKAGLEMAIWDLQGKREGRSLQNMLGGTRKRVDVGVSVGLQNSALDLVSVVENYLKNGYRRIKIKIKPGRDVEDTHAVRHAFPDLRLQVDANSAYTLETAKSLFPLDELNLLMIEQPLYEDDLWDHHYLQSQLATPLCLDESIHSARHAWQAIQMQACQVINIKVGRVGGLTQALSTHDICQTNGIPVWCGGMLETGVGRAANLALASLPGFTLPGDISASARYYAEDITHERFSLNPDSTIDVPDLPGLGVTINPEALKRATLAKLELS